MEHEPDYEWRHKFDARYKSGYPGKMGIGRLLFYSLIVIAAIMAIVRWV